MTTPALPPGLCAACRYHRILRTARGSTFWLCRRSETDVRFPRYPTLPVVRCIGYERAEVGDRPG